MTLADRPDLWPLLQSDDLNPGPSFIYHDQTSARWWRKFEAAYPDFHIVMVEQGGRVVAHGRAIPLASPRDSDLPDTGWDFALEQGMLDYEAGRPPTMACALWIVVAADFQRQGLSARMISGLRAVAAAHGIDSLVAPVRPTLKSSYPLVTMHEYITWTGPDGAPFDPWLRTHWRLGGRIIGVCGRSMLISGSVADWESWTGMAMPATGQYVVPGALAPVSVDRAADTATYVEENVWVRHEVAPSATE